MMESAIEKAAALVEAHHYIRRFNGKTIVVKIGGSIMDDPGALSGMIQDICFMDAVGMHPVVVHGGGKGITKSMAQAGIEAQFVQGRRYTDERTLAIAEHVLVNQINQSIIEQINQLDHRGVGLHSLASCVVFADRLFLSEPDGDQDRKIDIGEVGEVRWVNADLLTALTGAGYIPVIAPIARDGGGGKLNVNADSVAGHVAAAIKAEKIVLVSDTHGVRTGSAQDAYAKHLTKVEIARLVDNGTISEGMLPKVQASLTALEAGVSKAHIVDGRIPHSLMLEVYTDQGIGTELVL